eukprot:5096726-Amphidinium_carterae.2
MLFEKSLRYASKQALDHDDEQDDDDDDSGSLLDFLRTCMGKLFDAIIAKLTQTQRREANWNELGTYQDSD